jgi:integrase/recombinase XerC
MDIKICSNRELDLSKSCLISEIPDLLLDQKVKVNGVGVFDDSGKILPLISEYLSYQFKHEKIAHETANTYGKNLTYFLKYIRSRPDYSDDETDE